MIIGSHDSCTCKSKNECICLCWQWAKTQSTTLKEQFDLGVRLFDLRYKLNDIYYISHTLDTMYTLENALTELVKCSIDANEYIYIRLKRDSSSYPLPSFGYTLESIKIHGVPLSQYLVEYGTVDKTFNGGAIRRYMKKIPTSNRRIILYSDDNTLSEDNVPSAWFFPQLFDTVETWGCAQIDDAVSVIKDGHFKNNGLPKAIFVDFSSIYPPEIAFDYIWKRVKETIINYIIRGDIDCIVVNHISHDLVQTIKDVA
jgi:hypothetical protein